MELFVFLSTKSFMIEAEMWIWNSTMMALLFNFGTLAWKIFWLWSLEFSTRFSLGESSIIAVPSWKNWCYFWIISTKNQRTTPGSTKKTWLVLSVFENKLKRRLKMEWEIDFSAHFRMCLFNMNVDTIGQSNSWMNTFLAVLWFSCLLLLVAEKW